LRNQREHARVWPCAHPIVAKAAILNSQQLNTVTHFDACVCVCFREWQKHSVSVHRHMRGDAHTSRASLITCHIWDSLQLHSMITSKLPLPGGARTPFMDPPCLLGQRALQFNTISLCTNQYMVCPMVWRASAPFQVPYRPNPSDVSTLMINQIARQHTEYELQCTGLGDVSNP